jgi:hypothetical protein
VVPAGVETAVPLTLAPVPTTRTERRFPVWMPWTVFGAGLAVAAAGIPLYLSGQSDFQAFDESLNARCAGASCGQLAGDTALEDRAQAKHAAAITMWSVGGAATIAGIVLLALNVERQVSNDEAALTGGWIPTRGGGLMTMGGRF